MSSGEIKGCYCGGNLEQQQPLRRVLSRKSMDYLPQNIKTAKSTEMNNDPKADEYLKFIANEVKPFVDKTYSVNTDVSNTFVAGSRMVGWISWYAMCEYPSVFGSAICMSTHLGVLNTDDASSRSVPKYLLNKLPSPTNMQFISITER